MDTCWDRTNRNLKTYDISAWKILKWVKLTDSNEKNRTNTIILSTDPYIKSIFESRTDRMRIKLIILRYQSTPHPTILSQGLSSDISETSPNTEAGEIIPDKMLLSLYLEWFLERNKVKQVLFLNLLPKAACSVCNLWPGPGVQYPPPRIKLARGNFWNHKKSWPKLI